MRHQEDLAIHDSSDTLIIIDSGCDQSIINKKSFSILSKSGTYYHVNGALADRMTTSEPLQVVNGATKVTTKNGEKYILVINQALLDTSEQQLEALLQPHQCRAHGVCVDDCATRHKHIDGSNGGQCIQVASYNLPLYYDGYKCYFITSKPSPEDLTQLPHIELTSPLQYEPDRRVYTRRRKTHDVIPIGEWRARLGYPTEAVVKNTLQCTTRLVDTVEAETSEYMRDHYKSRLLCLRPHRLNDICFSDTFFSSIKSVRGYTMFQMFSLCDCGHDVPYLMRKESQASNCFRDFVRQIGAPRVIVNDNAKTMTGNNWLSVCRDFCIEDHNSEAYHQNQNLAERRGGIYKLAIIKLFHNTPTSVPISFWCYALEFIALVRGCLARKSLNWKPSEEILFGETVNISVFRFPWFSPVWYYDPGQSFPHDKMKKGFFLNVSPTVGDAFSYVILPENEFQKHIRYPRYNSVTLIRSVVRIRKVEDSWENVADDYSSTFILTNVRGDQVDADTTINADDILVSTQDEESDSISEYPADDTDVDNDGYLVNPLSTQLPTPSESVTDDIVLEEAPSPPDQASVDNIILDPITPHPVHVATTTPPSSSHKIPMASQTQDSDDDNSTTSNVNDNGDNPNIEALFHQYRDFDDMEDIVSHRWGDGVLELEVQYKTATPISSCMTWF